MQIGNLHQWTGTQESIKLICLHGFLGAGTDFEVIVDHYPDHPTLIAPDFPDYSRPPTHTFSWDRCLDTLGQLVASESADSACVLVGYSMGGRIALQYAVRHPEHLAGLVLIGTTPGLLHEDERSMRRHSDQTRAEQMMRQTLDEFLNGWFQQDLIQSQRTIPEPYQSRMRNTRYSNDKTALAQALISLGTGTMPSVWDQLTSIHVPSLLVTGAMDPKFHTVAEEMLQKLPNASHASLKDAGHACCFERPDAFANALASYLSSHIHE